MLGRTNKWAGATRVLSQLGLLRRCEGTSEQGGGSSIGTSKGPIEAAEWGYRQVGDELAFVGGSCRRGSPVRLHAIE